jgi:hypothetical protein
MGDPTSSGPLAIIPTLREILRRLRKLESGNTGVVTVRSLIASMFVRSPGVRTNPLTNNPIALAIDADGNFGYIPSSLEKKTIIGPYTVDMTAWLNQPLMRFTYDGDPTGRVSVGWIAESLDQAGLKEFVVYAPNGTIQGVRVETLIAGLHSAYIQSRSVSVARIAALEATLNTAVGNKMHQVFEYSVLPALTVLASQKDLTISWPRPFTDTDYTIQAVFTPPAGVLVGLSYFVKSRTTTGCVITMYTNGVALPSGGYMRVDANHL